MTEDSQLTSGHYRRSLARNAVWNLIGQGMPLIAAIGAIPGLLIALGTDRFGVLTLAWLVVGYFSLFDFGIGRALTKLVAEQSGVESHNQISNLVWSAITLLAGVGVVMALILGTLSEWLANVVLKIPLSLQIETEHAFYVLALTIPFVISTSALRGVLEAKQHFAVINAIRIPLGILTFVGPLIVALYTNELPAIVLMLAALRIAAWVAHLYLCVKTLPYGGGFKVRVDAMRALLRLGSWMTVSNLVGPLMVYLDRFLIGAFISMAAVAYYATPYEIISKLWLIPAAISAVLFPAFAMHLRENALEAVQLLMSGMKWVFLTVFPLTLLVVTFSQEMLTMWLGQEFAINSTMVLQILAAGVLINCVAQIPFAFIQAAGRADLTAKLHLMELPVYLIGVYWLLGVYGVNGVAFAWLVRVAVDLLMLIVLSRFWFKGMNIATNFIVTAVLALVLLYFGMALDSIVIKMVFTIAALSALAIVVWRHVLSPGEKRFLWNPLRVPDSRDRSPHP